MLESSSSSSHQPSTLQGYLQKRTVSGLRRWNQRYFRLHGHLLRYFNHETDNDPKNVYNLRDTISITPAPPHETASFWMTDTKACFCLYFKTETISCLQGECLWCCVLLVVALLKVV